MVIKAQMFIGVSFVSINFPAFAESEVGKHVGANLNAASMIMSLMMVLVVIVACAFILKKFNFTMPQAKGLKVIRSLHLTNKEKIVVVEVGDKQLLLGVTNQQINLLDTLEKPLDVEPLKAPAWPMTIQTLLKKRS